jgi:hypothetical protein
MSRPISGLCRHAPYGVRLYIPLDDHLVSKNRRELFAHNLPLMERIRYLTLPHCSHCPSRTIDLVNLFTLLPLPQARWSGFEYPSLITSYPGRTLPSCPLPIVPSRIVYCRIFIYHTSGHFKLRCPLRPLPHLQGNNLQPW